MSSWKKVLFHSRLLSPRGLLSRALMLLTVFLLLQLAGLREYTSIFSGTSPLATTPSEWTRLLGVLYALFYLCSVVLVPIMVLAAIIMWGAVLLHRRRRASLKS